MRRRLTRPLRYGLGRRLLRDRLDFRDQTGIEFKESWVKAIGYVEYSAHFAGLCMYRGDRIIRAARGAGSTTICNLRLALLNYAGTVAEPLMAEDERAFRPLFTSVVRSAAAVPQCDVAPQAVR